MAQIFSSIAQAWKFCLQNLFYRPLRSILLMLLLIFASLAYFIGIQQLTGVGVRTVPFIGAVMVCFAGIVYLFMAGVAVQIMGKKSFSLKKFFHYLLPGLQYIFIAAVYLAIPFLLLVLYALLGFFADAGLRFGDIFLTPGVNILDYLSATGIGALLFIPVLFVAVIFMIPAGISFSREGRIRSAFNLKKIADMIGKAKWKKIIGGFFALFLILFPLFMLTGILTAILHSISSAGLAFAGLFNAIISLFSFFFSLAFWVDFYEEPPELPILQET